MIRHSLTIACLAMLAVLVHSCQSSSNAKEVSPSQFADIICKCAQPIVVYNNALREMAAADDMGALSQKMAEADSIMSSAHQCISDRMSASTKQLIGSQLEEMISDQCHLDKRMVVDLLEKAAEYEELPF